MKRRGIALSVLLFTATATVVVSNSAVANAEPAAQCAPLVGVSVRGFQETFENEKFASPTIAAVQKKLDRPIELHRIRYDASVYNAETQAAGAAHLTAYLHAKANNCPNTKFVIVGYSQGALITGNVLDQNDINGSKILGVVFYGDPRFNSSESFDRGTYNHHISGKYDPRPTDALQPYEARLHSYCRVDDNVCQNIQDGGGHILYGEYVDDAANFLVGQIRSAG